uniref:Small ribosomal subunit protein uS11c n=1 Tax=Adenophora divaricata TaxID=82271 RepID=A0A2D0WTB5_9ASTR|nr:ribosomal protein S11 [Adenophora divaricata]ARO35009.1 ribosomal protein S11 [Adenophora divaricata]
MAKAILKFRSRRTRRRSRRRIHRIPKGRIHVQAGFNNIIVTVTDLQGRVLSSSSAGNCRLRAKRKATAFAGEAVASHALSSVVMKRAEVMIKGPGLGRDTALRAIQRSRIRIIFVKDVTPFPHNGCRPPNKRRV